MKKSYVIGVLVVLLVGLSVSANRIVAKLVAERLPGILTQATGQQITLHGISVNVWQLRVNADELSLGSPSEPHLVFKNLFIELNSRQLLSGRVDLDDAYSESTDIYTERWPVSQSSEPVNLVGVQRWIPAQIRIGLLNLREEGRLVYAFTDLEYKVLEATARQATWSQSREDVSLQFKLTTDNADAIFSRQSAQLNFQISAQKKAASSTKPQVLLTAGLSSKPQDGEGFATTVELDSVAFKGDWLFSTPSLFALPNSSRLQLSLLTPYNLHLLAPLIKVSGQQLAGTSVAAQTEDFMKQPLPKFALLNHKLDLRVTDLNFDDEKIQNLNATVTLHAASKDQQAQILITDLQAELPRADVKGSVDLTMAEEWLTKLQLSVITRSREPERLRGFERTDWLWSAGNADLISHGAALEALIDNAKGEVDISGAYRAASEVPFRLKVHVKDSQGRIGADDIEFTIGTSRVDGSVWIDDDRKNLRVRLHTNKFDVAELLSPEESTVNAAEAGIAVPELGWWDSQLQIDAEVTGDVVQLPGVALTGFDTKLTLGPKSEKLDLAFNSDRIGRLHAQLQTVRKGDLRNLDMNLQLTKLAARAVALDVEATMTGGLRAQGSGKSMRELLQGLTSQVSATADFDKTEGNLQIFGNPQLVLADDRIVGFSFSNISVRSATAPVASGKFSYDARVPLFNGELSSDHFDADELLSVFPAPRSSASSTSLTELLSRLPHVQLSLQTQTLKLLGRDLLGFSTQLSSRPEELKIDSLQFRSEIGDLQANAVVHADAKLAQFELNGKVGDLVITSLLKGQKLPQLDHPVEGTVKLTTQGADWQALTANLRGEVDLQTDVSTPREDQLKLDMVVQPDGQSIDIKLNEARFAQSDLQGEATFTPGKVPKLRLDLQSNYLNTADWQQLVGAELEPLEEKVVGDSTAAAGDDSASVFRLVDNSVSVLRDMLRSPLRLFGFGKRSDEKEFFSTKPFQLGDLAGVDADVHLELAELIASNSEGKGISVTGSVEQGLIDVVIDAETINGGSSKLKIWFDSQATPPGIKLSGDVQNYQPENNPSMSSRSAFIELHSQGNSEAELAAAMNGEIFVEVGPGQSDLAELSSGFFSTDLLNRIISSLVPDRDKKPRLQCAVAYATVTDGTVVTPKAAVLQSAQANILVRAEIDLGKETIAVQFDSRSRKGAGLSVGNIFSNTVRIRGTLLKPTLAPNATGIAWRSWAALATGGLSLLGESFIKRILASDQACNHLKADISKLVCGGTTLAAKSPLVCPAA